MNTPLCDVANPGETKYYTTGAVYAPTNYTTVEIYAVNADGPECSVNGYITTGGLPSSTCQDSSKDCNGPCGGTANTCPWKIDCPFTGNISVGVENPGANSVDYFVVWNSVSVDAVPLTVNQMQQSPVGKTESYYSFTLPTVDPTSQYLVVYAESESTDVISMWYNLDAIPGNNCHESTCSDNGGCFIVINSCSSVPAGTGYLYVTSDSQYTIGVSVYDIDVQDIQLNSFTETSLSVDAGSPFDMVSFTVTISEDMIANSAYGDMAISIYGVNQGTLDAWVHASQIGTFGPSGCSISYASVDSDGDVLVVDACVFTSGTYFVSALLQTSGQDDACTPVTLGVMATMATASENIIPLTSGVAMQANSSYYDETYYSFSSTSDIVSVLVDSLDANAFIWERAFNQDITDPFLCVSLLTTPIQYFWGCESVADDFSIIVNPVSITTGDYITPAGEYTVQATGSSFLNLTTASASESFTASYDEMHFYVFSNNEAESVNIDLEVTQGPAVTLQVWDNQCNTNGENQVLSSLVCYSGHCTIPFSWGNGDIFNQTYSYHITVQGHGPASYNLQVLVGEENTCLEPTENDNDLCDITWTVWDYGTGDNGQTNQAAAANQFYNLLVNAFCPPCGCSEISSACNSSLIEYACTQSYRACADNGLQTSICEDSCEDIEENCGYTFSEVGLPWLSCSHNFYYGDSDEICEDIYGITETDETDVILWIVIAIVVLIVLLLLFAALAFFGFKKYKTQRMSGSYEKIEEGESDE